MKKLFGFGVAALAVTLVAGKASADFAAELKCESNASKSVSKYAGSQVGCRNKCWAGVRKGDATKNCDPAALDTVTQACITAAQQKATGYAGKCSDCPECYDNGNCGSDAVGKIQTATNLVNTQDSGQPGTVHCGTTSSTTKENGACQDNTGKVLTKFVSALAKCTQKCKANEAKGKVAAGSCDPPASDPGTQGCISAAQGKCVTGVDKKCGANAPACWSAPYNNGAGWCALVHGIVDSQYNEFFCEGSPSGAFLE